MATFTLAFPRRNGNDDAFELFVPFYGLSERMRYRSWVFVRDVLRNQRNHVQSDSRLYDRALVRHRRFLDWTRLNLTMFWHL